MTQSLEGVHVLDLSRFIAGPSCAMYLGDMGADVIKVEKPGGEEARLNLPMVGGHSLYTMVNNRNKRAVTVNTRAEAGIDLLRRLVAWADVVVENYRPGTMEAMGLGYPQLEAIKPGIILTSISGLGQTGPKRHRAMFDAAVQSASGVTYRNGRAEEPPMFTGVFVADYLAGAYAAFATLAALRHKERTGEGQVIDIALLDSLVPVMAVHLSAWLALGEKLPRSGNRDAYTAPANIFRAVDGYVYFHAGTDPLFRRFAESIHRTDLLEDERFATSPARMAHVGEIEAIVESWLATRTVEEACATFEKAGIPYSPVHDVEQVTADEQLLAREMFVEIEHAEAGTVPLPGVVFKMSATPASIRRPPPVAGQHNREVLGEVLGMGEDEIAALEAEGVL